MFFGQMERKNTDDFRIDFFSCGDVKRNIEFARQEFEQGVFVNKTARDENMAQVYAKVFLRGLRQRELIAREKAFTNKVFSKFLDRFSRKGNGLFFCSGANRKSLLFYRPVFETILGKE